LTYRSLVDRENNQVIMFEEVSFLLPAIVSVSIHLAVPRTDRQYASQEAIDEHMKAEGYQTLVARSSELFG
jgi:TRAP-type mannitol/chloroaromatic compound transport system permease small subunit